MARFYVDHSLAPGIKVELPNDIVSHLNAVRVRATDSITLFNGDGHDYEATFIEFKKRQVSVEILQKRKLTNEANLKITLMMAIIANERFDLVIQKAVELGVSNIIPIYCQNTQRFKSDKLDNKMKHWKNIIFAASEQSGRATLADLEIPQEFHEAIKNIHGEIKVILSPHHTGKFEASDEEINHIALLVGPEGGFTVDEVESALKHGFSTVRLGDRILRAETAAIAGISLLQNHFGDFEFLS